MTGWLYGYGGILFDDVHVALHRTFLNEKVSRESYSSVGKLLLGPIVLTQSWSVFSFLHESHSKYVVAKKSICYTFVIQILWYRLHQGFYFLQPLKESMQIHSKQVFEFFISFLKWERRALL